VGEKLTLAAPVRLADVDVAAWKGRSLEDSHFDVLVGDGRVIGDGLSSTRRYDQITITKPDGSPLLVHRPDCLARSACERAYRAFKDVTLTSANRGGATGEMRFTPTKRDGTTSRTSQTEPINSGIVGYYDRYPRMPFCRMTAFNMDHSDKFESARPLVNAVNRVFAETLPDRYETQREIAARTSPDFLIGSTAFTTITVNRNLRTVQHKDEGDYRPGFGVMSVLEAGRYGGGFLVFPQYRIAVDMRTGGVCLADVHEWHGNTPIVGVPGKFVRLSMVFYYRARMVECGSAAEELARAKER
jgi:hypothetical protein